MMSRWKRPRTRPMGRSLFRCKSSRNWSLIMGRSKLRRKRPRIRRSRRRLLRRTSSMKSSRLMSRWKLRNRKLSDVLDVIKPLRPRPFLPSIGSTASLRENAGSARKSLPRGNR
uniref:(northern house mosquito) hypothetical protein n=1 Tax=Culex pipiens TaxID=7175 RepID=A0A8D8HJ72_CULPI